MPKFVYVFTLPLCPKCNVLKKKIAAKGIKIEEVTDITYSEALGIIDFPTMETPDGQRYSFEEAVQWVNNL